MNDESLPALLGAALLLAVFVLLRLTAHPEAAGVEAATAPASCPAMPPPPVMISQFDPAPKRYLIPDDPAPPGYFLDDKGATTIFQDAGTLEGHLCPDQDVDWYFTQTAWVKHDAPACWVYEPVQISPCPPVGPPP